MHYGHPDVFDRIFHITRGGISKASRVINISEDIYAGMRSRLVLYIFKFLIAVLNLISSF
jgi:callose synthase